jgi:hypothetical protein
LWFETPAAVESASQYKGGVAFQQPISHFHLRWSPVSKGINFERMSQNLFSQMVNHFEGHAEITTKNKLFKNITKWHDENSVSVFKRVLPLTFCLKVPILSSGEVDSKILSSELKSFKQVFKLFAQHKDDLLAFNDLTKT